MRKLFSLTLETAARALAVVLLAAACIAAMVGCAADGDGSTGSTDSTDSAVTAGISSVAENEEPTASADRFGNGDAEVPEDPPMGCEAMLLLDMKAEGYDPDEEELFTLPEFPDVQFLRRGGAVYALYGDTRRYVMSGTPLYLADLNGDGNREFCTTGTLGSGIIDQRIYVYDFADDMRYTLHQRTEYDYDLSLVDGKLIALRYAYMGIYRDQEPLCEGTLAIEDRQLAFVSGDLRIPGIVSSPRFTPDLLQEMIAMIQEDMDQERWFSVFFSSATNYYMEIHQAAIRPSIAEEDEKRIWLDLGNIQDNRDVLQYLSMLELLTGTYTGYSYLEEYVYHDPTDPSRLIVCTELRDCGYREIQTYCEDLIAGRCQAHPDTYIVYLNRHEVCRWGEDTNLYQEAG